MRRMKEVTVQEATQHLGDLVSAAVGGEDVPLFRDDQAAVRLVPVFANGRPEFGSVRGLIIMSDDFDAPIEDFREHIE